MNINRKYILLFATLSLLLIGITAVAATSNTTINDNQDSINSQVAVTVSNSSQTITNDNNANKDSINQDTKNTNNNIIQETTDKQSQQSDQKSITPSQAVTKKVTKESNNTVTDGKQVSENTKTLKESKNNTLQTAVKKEYQVTVNNYTELYNAIDSIKNDTTNTEATIYLNEGNYTVDTPITWGNSNGTINTLTINGNNHKINGNNAYKFITIENNYTLNLNNILIENTYDDFGTICNYGTLNLTNSNIINNNASSIFNKNICTITNTTFSNNIAIDGSAIFNRGNITLINSTLSNNIVQSYGGVIVNFGDIYILNSIVNNNSALAGGAIFNQEGTITLVNSTFYKNNAKHAGVLYIEDEDDLNIINCSFISNNAFQQSNFYIKNCQSLNIINSSFINNTASDSESIKILNSIVYMDNLLFVNNNGKTAGGFSLSNSEAMIKNTRFYNNTANNGDGGAVHSLNSTLILSNCEFKNNHAKYGAGICQLDGTIKLDNDTFTNNIVKYNGGALCIINAQTTITSSRFTNNTAYENGGAIYAQAINNAVIESSSFINNTAINDGGAIYIIKSLYIINNNAFVNNNKNYVCSEDDHFSNLDKNWWGQNNPDFNTITQGITPDTWIVMTFTNTTYMNNTNIGLKVTLNSLNTGKAYNNTLLPETVTFTSNTGTFTNNTLEITNVVTNTYTGNTKDVYATIDNQTLKLSNKIIPTITTENITTYYNSTITITANINEDATGLACIKINGKTIKTNITVENGIITYTYNIPSTWKNNNYTITIKYSGDNKYQNNTVNAILTLIKQPTNTRTQNNITIIPIITTTNDTYIPIPGKYDLRDYGLVTPVKNQQESGSCWTFAACGTLESDILKQLNKTYDFSENNMKNIVGKYSLYGINSSPNIGGNIIFSSSYLNSWFGTVNETQDPYCDASCISPILNSTVHIQNILYIPNRQNATDNDQIKEAILKYGAVATNYYVDQTGPSYNPTTHAYYYNNYTIQDHTVTIVGWDDNYDKSNFLITPPGNGAFIVKNSWGSEWGENGYFYVSYYDTMFARTSNAEELYNTNDDLLNTIYITYAFILNNTEEYQNNYQQETIGSLSPLGYNTTEVWIKNQYTAKSNENIAAFGTYILTKSKYTAYIYINDKLQYTQNGTTDTGYKTIQLNKYIPLTQNDTFQIILKLNSQTKNNSYALITGPSTLPLLDNKNLETKANQSFISKNGKDWDDLHYISDPSAACLKVYTLNSPNMTTITNSTNSKAGDSISITTKINDTLIKTGKVVFKLNGITLKDTNGNPIKVNLNNGIATVNYTIPSNLSKTNYTLTTLLVTNNKRIEENTTLTLVKS